MNQFSPPPSPPPPQPLWQRLLAASSFALTIAAGLLIYSAYQDRALGLTPLNMLRLFATGACIALAVKGTQLRHKSPPTTPNEHSSTDP